MKEKHGKHPGKAPLDDVAPRAAEEAAPDDGSPADDDRAGPAGKHAGTRVGPSADSTSGDEASMSADPAPQTNSRVRDLEAEVAAWKDKATRARADYDNFHKRIARDADVERLRNKARVLEGFLPLAELARMAAHQAKDVEGSLAEGVAMMAREFDRLLDREGVAAIDQTGVPFDRAQHEALAEEAMDGIAPGHVARIIQPGYRLGDKVLRHAKVTVAPRA